MNLPDVGEQIADRRKALRITQTELAAQAGVGRSTLDALENGRLGELGFVKVARIAAALSLELRLQPASSRRPTLDELLDENRDDQGLDGRR